jgi:hypothetical protein
VLLAVAGLYMAGAGSASAGWFIEGRELAGTAALATTASVDEAFKLKIAAAGEPITIECTGTNLNSVTPEIVASSRIAAASLTFSGCNASGSNCSLATKGITTVPLLAELTGQTYPEDKENFTPKTKIAFATFKFNGALCALEGIQAVTGKATTTLPTGGEEKALQQVKAKTTKGDLKVGGSEAELTGAALIKLATGELYKLLPTDVTVTPKTVHFGAANTTEKLLTNAVEDGEYMILEQKPTDDVNDRFSIVGGTSPCLNKKLAKPSKMNEPEKCSFEVQATGLVDGEDAKLVTKYDREPAVFQTTYYNNLEW